MMGARGESLMALSYNEIRRRAVEFAREYRDAERENAETQSFYNDFFNVFGITRRRVASFEEPVKKLGEKKGRIDAFWTHDFTEVTLTEVAGWIELGGAVRGVRVHVDTGEVTVGTAHPTALTGISGPYGLTLNEDVARQHLKPGSSFFGDEAYPT